MVIRKPIRDRVSRMSKYSLQIGASLLCAGVLVVAGTMLANEKAPTEKDQSKSASNRSLDDELLKSLHSEPLDDSAQGKKGQGGGAKTKQNSQSDGASSLDNQLLDDLGGEDIGRAGESQNPLVRIERKMRTVEKRLAAGDLDRQTADLQRQILDELAQFTQQCKAACKSGDGANKPSKPGAGNKAGSTAGHAPATTLPRDSSTQLQKRDTQLGDRRTAADALKESWGNLPERFRDQLSAPPGDEVLPKYEAMLKKYFQRLAEDDSTGP
jgi:hypothetical protein